MGGEYAKKGGTWGICDDCGDKRRLYELKRNWQGLRVCQDTCWEPQHPQDKPPIPRKIVQIIDPRPQPAMVFMEDTDEGKID